MRCAYDMLVLVCLGLTYHFSKVARKSLNDLLWARDIQDIETRSGQPRMKLLCGPNAAEINAGLKRVANS